MDQPGACTLLLILSASYALGTHKTISLTIASPSRHDDGGSLVMQWEQPTEADFMAVFNTIPPQTYTPVSDVQPLFWVNPSLHPEGYKHTNITFIQHSFPDGCVACKEGDTVIGDECTIYQIAAYLDGELLEADCLTVRPTWMEDNKSELRNIPLAALFFPMYHNFNRHHERSLELPIEMVGQHVLAPNTNVWGLLVKGIRYFTLNIGSQWHENEVPCDSREMTNKEQCYVSTLIQVFNDVKEYLTLAPYEIVILDIHRVPVMSDWYTIQPRKIAKLLYSILGDFILPPKNLNYSSPLETIWDTCRHLIVTFSDFRLLNEFWWAWRPIYNVKGDKPPSDIFKAVLKKCLFDERAYYTPNNQFNNVTVTAVFETLGGAKNNVTKWFQNYWLTSEDTSTTQLYIGNTISDVPTIACLDELSNVIFQVVYEVDVLC